MPLDHTVAVAHLQHTDPVLGQIIVRCGPCTLQPRDLEPLVMLCRSIVYQQLSGKAAGTIMMRFLGLYEPNALTPEALLRIHRCHMVFVAQSGWGCHTLPGNARRRVEMVSTSPAKLAWHLRYAVFRQHARAERPGLCPERSGRPRHC